MYTDPVTSRQASRLWSLFNSVEAEALVNALRRWQSSFGIGRSTAARKTTVNDPYVRLVLDRYAQAQAQRTATTEQVRSLIRACLSCTVSKRDRWTPLPWLQHAARQHRHCRSTVACVMQCSVIAHMQVPAWRGRSAAMSGALGPADAKCHRCAYGGH